jgi:curved DNA-binding protein CbpA
VPLLRLDFGALYDKYIGETEKNLRKALATADVMSPCVLWIDEIEKGVATGAEDDGVGRRILGTLLTWMAERNTRVFLTATANDISRLPPELIRKGRIDELFFVDLPGAPVRREIFAIHLLKRRIDPERFDLARLAEASEGFTGAGIEQAIVSALYADETAGDGLTTAGLLGEIANTQPLSVVMHGQLQALRAWASGRTVQAHAPEEQDDPAAIALDDAAEIAFARMESTREERRRAAAGATRIARSLERDPCNERRKPIPPLTTRGSRVRVGQTFRGAAMEYKDYYKTLGVARDATQAEIKRAYRKLARKFHPTSARSPTPRARFKEINEANEVLHDPEKRAAYDALGSSWRAGQDFRPPPGGVHHDFHFGPDEAAEFSDFFSSIFGGEFHPGAQDQRRRRGQDQSVRIGSTWKRPIAAGRGNCASTSRRSAPTGGSHRAPEPERAHPARRHARPPDPAGRPRRHPGSTAVMPAISIWRSTSTRTVSSPRTARTSICDCPIAPWEAALGASVSVPTLGGTVNLKVPPGSQSGQRLRLKGRGLPGDPPGTSWSCWRSSPPRNDGCRQGGLSRDGRASTLQPKGRDGSLTHDADRDTH